MRHYVYVAALIERDAPWASLQRAWHRCRAWCRPGITGTLFYAMSIARPSFVHTSFYAEDEDDAYRKGHLLLDTLNPERHHLLNDYVIDLGLAPGA